MKKVCIFLATVLLLSFAYIMPAQAASPAAPKASVELLKTKKPSAPSGLSTSNKPDGSITIKWNKVKGAKKYNVYMSTSYNGKYSKKGSTTKTKYTIKGLKNKKVYYFKVSALNSAGESKKSILFERAKKGNKPPRLRSFEYKVLNRNQVVNTPLHIYLGEYYEDPDGDELNYRVSIDGAPQIAASADFTYTPTKLGSTTLYFVANDRFADSSDACTVIVTAKLDNNPPNRKSGVPATVSKDITVFDNYALDLGGIFEDQDNNNLTYKVSINNASPVEANKGFNYTPKFPGAITLRFVANDGKADSTDTYTVNLTASDPSAAPVTYSGTGNQDINSIDLKYKFYTVRVAHSGMADFVIKDYFNNNWDLLLNETGNYSGTVLMQNIGSHKLSIQADGAWTIELRPLVSTDAVTFSGTGNSVTSYFTMPNSGIWSITHSGASNFIVIAHTLDKSETIVNDTGAYSDSKTTEIAAGDTAFFEVIADGTWSISLKKM
jgi:hypothetical protein